LARGLPEPVTLIGGKTQQLEPTRERPASR